MAESKMGFRATAPRSTASDGWWAWQSSAGGWGLIRDRAVAEALRELRYTVIELVKRDRETALRELLIAINRCQVICPKAADQVRLRGAKRNAMRLLRDQPSA